MQQHLRRPSYLVLGGARTLARLGEDGAHPAILSAVVRHLRAPCACSRPSTSSQAAVGEELGVTEWIEIDQDRVNLFADATDDHQWIHVDEERSAAGPFGGTIAHGYLTLSLIPMLSSQHLHDGDPGPRLNYGLNKVRFPMPVQGRRPHPRPRHLVSLTDVPGRQAADRPLHDRGRGRGQAGLRGRDRRAAALRWSSRERSERVETAQAEAGHIARPGKSRPRLRRSPHRRRSAPPGSTTDPRPGSFASPCVGTVIATPSPTARSTQPSSLRFNVARTRPVCETPPVSR